MMIDELLSSVEVHELHDIVSGLRVEKCICRRKGKVFQVPGTQALELRIINFKPVMSQLVNEARAIRKTLEFS